MKMLLIHEDLFECVNEVDKKNKPECEDKKKQEKALARICLSVQPSVYSVVRNCNTAFDAWKNIQNSFEDKGLCRRLGLLRMLFSLKLEQFESMEVYVTKILDTAQQLQDINASLEDEFVAIIMLSGLPKQFDPLIMTLEHSSLSLSSELVKTKLLQEAQRRGDAEGTEQNALTTSTSISKRPKCFRCKKLGHYARDCRQKATHKDKPSSSSCQEEEKVQKTPGRTTMLSALMVKLDRDVWYVDSGATCHMTNNRDILHDFVCDTPKEISVANGEKLFTMGRGNVKLFLQNQWVTVSNVVFIPNLSCNLLSVTILTQKCFEVKFISNFCKIYENGKVVAVAKRDACGLYKLETGDASINSVSSEHSMPVSVSLSTQVEVQSQGLWHRRLGHLNSRSMNLLKSGMATGIDYDVSTYEQCIACIEGKVTNLPFPKKSFSRASEVLGLVHTDVCGPMPVKSIGGARYLLTFIDDFSRKTFCYSIESKDKVFECFLIFKALVENETNKKIKILRSDNGGEYINTRFKQYLSQCGIRHHTTVPHCPQQNAVAERANRTIMEAVRCMLLEAGLDQRFWAEAANTAVYIKNRSPTKAVRGATPEEIYTGRKVNLDNLRVFGCLAYAVQNNRNKLDRKSKPYIFAGYCENTKGYRLLDVESYKLTIARNVKFIENQFLKHLNFTKVESDVIIELKTPCVSENRTESEQTSVTTDDANDSEASTSSLVTDHHSDATYVPDVSFETDDSRAEYVEADENFFLCGFLTGEACGSDDPRTVEEALNSPEARQWRAAMKDEYQSYLDNKCFTLTDLPKGAKPIKTKWIFKKKRGLNGELLQYKARLVAKGFTQKYGVDYFETFSPVVRYETIRMLLALAVEYDMEIDHMDVKTAFLNGDLKETIFMEIPEGFEKGRGNNKVYQLRKAVYGLKQAPKSWNEKINHILVNKLNFKRLVSEPCVYINRNGDKFVIIALYVDDLVIFSNCNAEKTKTKSLLMKEFVMKDLGPVEKVLGLRIRKENGKITLDQSAYIKKILEKYKMQDCKSVETPMQCQKLNKAEEKDDSLEYRELIGCLMYVAVCSRPDICHAVSVLSQFNNCFSDVHWKAAKRVLRYLKGTVDYCITYKKTGLSVTGFADADWASNEIDRRSYTGYVFKIGNSITCWESRKQRTVALSSTEAEYMSLSDACKQALFIKTFLHECIGSNIEITIFNDNQSALKLTESSMFHGRSKHIDIRHHFVREAVSNGAVKINYMPTSKMTADVLTKPLSVEKHKYFVNELGLATDVCLQDKFKGRC